MTTKHVWLLCIIYRSEDDAEVAFIGEASVELVFERYPNDCDALLGLTGNEPITPAKQRFVIHLRYTKEAR